MLQPPLPPNTTGTWDRMPRPKKIKDIDNPDAALALLAHPYRVAILATLERRESASPRDVAIELGVGLENLAYHFRVLRDHGAIELVREEMSRGAVRHLYRLTGKPHITPAAWDKLPEFAKQVIAGNSLQHLWRETMTAVATGCMNRSEAVVGRFPLRLDGRGYSKAEALLKTAIAELKDIEAECQERIARHETDLEPTTVVVMLFDTPDPAAVLSLDRSMGMESHRAQRAETGAG